DFTDTLLNVYDVQMTDLSVGSLTLAPAAPTLIRPPFSSARVEAIFGIDTPRMDVVPHQFSEDQPVLVSFPEGLGTVWVSGSLRPFTNLGLNDPGDAALIANMLASVPHHAVIGFDEALHGFGDDTQTTLSGWLFGTATGWAILVAFVLTMIYLA